MSEHHEPTTLRSHLEAILRKHRPITEGHEFCACGAWPRPCLEQQHAVAALAILDNADDAFITAGPDTGAYRLVPDPEPST